MDDRIIKQKYDECHNRIMQILKVQENIIELLQKHYQEKYLKGKSAAQMYYTTFLLLEAKYQIEYRKQREILSL